MPKNTSPRFDKIDNDWKSIETIIQTIKSKLKKLPVKMPLGKPTDIHFFNVPTPKCQQHNPEETLYNQLFPSGTRLTPVVNQIFNDDGTRLRIDDLFFGDHDRHLEKKSR